MNAPSKYKGDDMTEEDLKKSITLIGPSCVGKSLLSNTLANKLNMNYVSIDDLLEMIEREKEGDLSPDPIKQKLFIKNALEDLCARDPAVNNAMENPKYKRMQIKLIKNVVDVYNHYVNLFGSLKPFYKILEDYQQRMLCAGCPVQRLANLNMVTVEMLAVIMRVVDQPLIFDMPAPFGWFPNDEDSAYNLENGELFFSHQKKVEVSHKIMSQFLEFTQTVLLCPGKDYSKRNSAKDSFENRWLLEHFQNYENARLSVSTNGFFNEPTNKHLRQRSWMGVEEYVVSNKLKNKSEIKNICDQIIMGFEDLQTLNE